MNEEECPRCTEPLDDNGICPGCSYGHPLDSYNDEEDE